MSKLSVVFCAVLFVSTAYSMDVDEELWNDALRFINSDEISCIAIYFRQNIENEIISFTEKAEEVNSNLVKIATNFEDASVNYCGLRVMNIDEDRKRHILNSAECIKEYEEILINLFGHCESLYQCSGIDKNMAFLNKFFSEEIKSPGACIKHLSIEDVREKAKQVFMSCEADERDDFYTTILNDINSKERRIKEKIEKICNSPAASSMDINEQNPDYALKTQQIDKYISIEARNINFENTLAILKALLKVNPDNVKLVSMFKNVKFNLNDIINSHVTGTNIILISTTNIKDDIETMMKEPGCRKATYMEMKTKEEVISSLSFAIKNNWSLEDVMVEIKKLRWYWRVDPCILSYADVEKNMEEVYDLPPQVNDLSPGELSIIVEKFSNHPHQMAKHLIMKLFNMEQLSKMSLSGTRGFTKFPALTAESIYYFVNGKAHCKITLRTYKNILRQTFTGARIGLEIPGCSKAAINRVVLEPTDEWIGLLGPSKTSQSVPGANPNEPHISYLTMEDLSRIVVGSQSDPRIMVRHLVLTMYGKGQILEMCRKEGCSEWWDMSSSTSSMFTMIYNFVRTHANRIFIISEYKRMLYTWCYTLMKTDLNKST